MSFLHPLPANPTQLTPTEPTTPTVNGKGKQREVIIEREREGETNPNVLSEGLWNRIEGTRERGGGGEGRAASGSGSGSGSGVGVGLGGQSWMKSGVYSSELFNSSVKQQPLEGAMRRLSVEKIVPREEPVVVLGDPNTKIVRSEGKEGSMDTGTEEVKRPLKRARKSTGGKPPPFKRVRALSESSSSASDISSVAESVPISTEVPIPEPAHQTPVASKPLVLSSPLSPSSPPTPPPPLKKKLPPLPGLPPLIKGELRSRTPRDPVPLPRDPIPIYLQGYIVRANSKMGPDGRKSERKKVGLNSSPQRLGRVQSDPMRLPVSDTTSNPFGTSNRKPKAALRQRSPILTADSAPLPPESDSSSSSSSDSSSDSEEEISDPVVSSRIYPLVDSSARYWRSLDPPLETLSHLDPADLLVGAHGRLVFAPHADPTFDPFPKLSRTYQANSGREKDSQPFERTRWDLIAMKHREGSIPYAWRKPAGMDKRIEEQVLWRKKGLKPIGFEALRRRAVIEREEKGLKDEMENGKEIGKEKEKEGVRRRVLSEEL